MNLDGVTVLDKKQQAGVKGGQRCRITIDGQTKMAHVGSEGAEGSEQANSYCVSQIESGFASSCKYDCEYDGFGQ